MKKSLVLILFVGVFMAGCASNKKIEPMMHSMKSVNQAISSFGPPSQVSPMQDGNSLYVWSSARNVSVGGMPVWQPNTQVHTGTIQTPTGGYAGTYTGVSQGGTVAYTPVQNVSLTCELRLIVNSNGYISNWSYTGNNCDALIINESSAVSAATPVAPPSLDKCLEVTTLRLANTEDSIEAIGRKAETECERSTGQRTENLAVYYARKAVDAKVK